MNQLFGLQHRSRTDPDIPYSLFLHIPNSLFIILFLLKLFLFLGK